MRKLNLTYRILLSFLIVGLITFSIITYFSYHQTINAKEKEAYGVLKTIVSSKKKELERHLLNKQNEVRILANSLPVKQLTKQLIAYRDFATIQAHEPFYVSTNEWQNIYNKFKNEFIEITSMKNNYDVLIINNNGQIMFSAKKEKSLGENLKTGRLKATLLADLWRDAQKTKEPIITDYFQFTPANNKIFYFIGVPILDFKQKPLATLVFQLSPDDINEITATSIEGYNNFQLLLLGSDYYLRNLQQDNGILNIKYKNEQIEDAFSINNSTLEIDNNKGEKLFSASSTVEFGDKTWLLLATIKKSEVDSLAKKQTSLLVVILVVILTLLLIPGYLFSKSIYSAFLDIKEVITTLSIGKFPEEDISNEGQYEVSQIKKQLKRLIEGLKKTTFFAIKIKDNKLDSDFTPLSKEDQLGNALLSMKKSLISANKEEIKRRDEDILRNWANEGYSILSDILRQFTGDIEGLADKIIQTIINYLKINQGGIYIISNDNQRTLELLASYAYDKKKFKDKKIKIGEGLIGMCALEKATIYLKEIPEDYIEITSGLGEAVPKSLLITPLIHENELMGVIELASFEEFKDYEIKFLEKTGENIASSLANAKVNYRTRLLLDETRKQAEEMAAQEEEMRQNLEEMQATREESARKELEMYNILEAVDNTLIRCEIDENGIFIYLNDEFEKTMGFIRNETVGAFAHSILAKNNKKEFERIWNIVIAGNTYESITQTHTKKGDEIWLLSSYNPVYDEDTNTLIKIIFLANDITQYKKNEIEVVQQANMLKAQEEFLRTSLKDMTDTQIQYKENEIINNAFQTTIKDLILFLEIDTKGQIASTNELFLSTIKETEKTVKGQSLRNYISENAHEIFDETWQNVCKGNNCNKNLEFIDKNGNKINVDMSLTPVLNETKKLLKILIFAIDNTNQHEANEKIIKLKEDIFQKENILTKTTDDVRLFHESAKNEIKELTTQKIELLNRLNEYKTAKENDLNTLRNEVETLHNLQIQGIKSSEKELSKFSEIDKVYIDWLKGFIEKKD